MLAFAKKTAKDLGAHTIHYRVYAILSRHRIGIYPRSYARRPADITTLALDFASQTGGM